MRRRVHHAEQELRPGEPVGRDARGRPDRGPGDDEGKFVEADFEQIAVFLHEALQIALKIQQESGPKLVEFVKCLKNNEEVGEWRKRVNHFAAGFPMPGFDPAGMKYKLEERVARSEDVRAHMDVLY